MLIIEFERIITDTEVIYLRYRNTQDTHIQWNYMNIDFNTLNLLLSNYGVISVIRIPNKPILLDNETFGTDIKLNVCNADAILDFRLNKLYKTNWLIQNPKFYKLD